MKNIVVEDCELDYTSAVGGSGGSIEITSTPDSDVQIDGKSVYTNAISISVSGFSLTDGSVQVAPVTASISASASYTCVNRGPVVLEGDSVSVSGISYFNSTTCVTTPETSFVVKIKCAGQTSVQAD